MVKLYVYNKVINNLVFIMFSLFHYVSVSLLELQFSSSWIRVHTCKFPWLGCQTVSLWETEDAGFYPWRKLLLFAFTTNLVILQCIGWHALSLQWLVFLFMLPSMPSVNYTFSELLPRVAQIGLQHQCLLEESVNTLQDKKWSELLLR